MKAIISSGWIKEQTPDIECLGMKDYLLKAGAAG